MKPKASKKLSNDDLFVIDLLCRKSLKQFLQSLSPEKLKEIIVSSQDTNTEEALPKHLRLEHLVFGQYHEQRCNVDSIKYRNFEVSTSKKVEVLQRDALAAMKNIACHLSKKASGGRSLTVSAGQLPSTKVAIYRCEWPRCETRRASIKDLRRHHNTHLELHKCSVCAKCCECAAHLREHYRRHDGLKQFACGFCQLTFKYNWCLTRHFKETHSDADKPFLCPDCPASASRRRNIHDHRVRIHGWNWQSEDISNI